MMSELKIGSLFSGYGGLDMAVSQFFGAEVVWHCEFEKAPSRILESHFPDVPNFGDVTKVDWASVEPVDILTGGFPCQDVSLAGQRKGLKDGTRSGLWSEFAKAIEVLKPRLVVIENVRGLLSAEAHSDVESCAWCLGDTGAQSPLRALGAVLGDLASLGYDAEWTSVRAADAGAPHNRFRVFIVAYPHGERGSWWGSEPGTIEKQRADSQVEVSDSGVERANLRLFPTPTTQDAKNIGGESQFERNTLPLNAEVLLLPTPTAMNPNDGEDLAQWEARRARVKEKAGNGNGFGTPLSIAVRLDWGKYAPSISRNAIHDIALLPTPNTMDMLPAREGEALEKARRRGNPERELSTVQNLRERVVTDSSLWGKYAPAIERWENTIGRTAPAPTETSKTGKQQLSAPFVEWMMGLPEGWVTKEEIGLTRNEQLKALGNGVVPQQATHALELLLFRN